MRLKLDEITHIQINFQRSQFGYEPGTMAHPRHDSYGFELTLESVSGELLRIESDGVKHWIGKGEPMPNPLTLSVDVKPEWDMVEDGCGYPSTPELPPGNKAMLAFGPDGLRGTNPEAVEIGEKLALLRKEAGEMLDALGALESTAARPCVNCRAKPSLRTSLSCEDCVEGGIK